MNGYTMLAESYKKLLQEGKVTEEEAKKNIKVMEFLAECSEEEINIMFDSAAFNEIMKEYVRRASSIADSNEYILINSLITRCETLSKNDIKEVIEDIIAVIC